MTIFRIPGGLGRGQEGNGGVRKKKDERKETTAKGVKKKKGTEERIKLKLVTGSDRQENFVHADACKEIKGSYKMKMGKIDQ